MNAEQVRAFVASCWPSAMQSPFALAARAADAADTACAAAAWCADNTAAMLADAEILAEAWRHLGADEQREQVDAHLESNWPDASEELRAQVVSHVVRAA